MIQNTELPSALGSKVVGKQAAIERTAAIAFPELGPLAKGVSDRAGNPLVDGAASVEADDQADDELNGKTPAPALAIVEPVVEQAVQAAETRTKKGK